SRSRNTDRLGGIAWRSAARSLLQNAARVWALPRCSDGQTEWPVREVLRDNEQPGANAGSREGRAPLAAGAALGLSAREHGHRASPGLSLHIYGPLLTPLNDFDSALCADGAIVECSGRVLRAD